MKNATHVWHFYLHNIFVFFILIIDFYFENILIVSILKN